MATDDSEAKTAMTDEDMDEVMEPETGNRVARVSRTSEEIRFKIGHLVYAPHLNDSIGTHAHKFTVYSVPWHCFWEPEVTIKTIFSDPAEDLIIVATKTGKGYRVEYIEPRASSQRALEQRNHTPIPDDVKQLTPTKQHLQQWTNALLGKLGLPKSTPIVEFIIPRDRTSTLVAPNDGPRILGVTDDYFSKMVKDKGGRQVTIVSIVNSQYLIKTDDNTQRGFSEWRKLELIKQYNPGRRGFVLPTTFFIANWMPDHERSFLVFPWVPSTTLRMVLESPTGVAQDGKPLTPLEWVVGMYDLVAALCYVDPTAGCDLTLLYGDLHSDQVLVTAAHKLRFVDVGLAELRQNVYDTNTRELKQINIIAGAKFTVPTNTAQEKFTEMFSKMAQKIPDSGALKSKILAIINSLTSIKLIHTASELHSILAEYFKPESLNGPNEHAPLPDIMAPLQKGKEEQPQQ